MNRTRKKNKNAWLGTTATKLTSENMTRVRHHQAQRSTTEQMSMEMTKH